MQQGWECPRCHKVNAPHVNSCDCVPVPVPTVTVNGATVTKTMFACGKCGYVHEATEPCREYTVGYWNPDYTSFKTIYIGKYDL